MKAEDSGLSRRSFLTTAGGMALGLGIARVPTTAFAADTVPALPWPYPQYGLDADVVRKSAYCLYYTQGGCGHGSAQSIIDALVVELPSPWGLLPRGLYSYGSGGVVGWGTICGALNGAIAVMDILGVHGKLGDALIDYFCNTDLPTNALVGWVPPDPKVPVPRASIATSVSYSPLCHNSVSIWAAAAGVPIADLSKKDRCAKLVGDIVARAVELMNDHFLRKLDPSPWVPPANYAGCYSCHTKADMIPSQQGKMDCVVCHDVVPAHGSSKKRNGNGGR